MAKLKFSSLKELHNYVHNLCASAYPGSEISSVQIRSGFWNKREKIGIAAFIEKKENGEDKEILTHHGSDFEDVNDCIKELLKALYPVPRVDKIELSRVFTINTDNDEN